MTWSSGEALFRLFTPSPIHCLGLVSSTRDPNFHTCMVLAYRRNFELFGLHDRGATFGSIVPSASSSRATRDNVSVPYAHT